MRFATTWRVLRAGGAPSAFGFNRPDIDALIVTARSAADPAQRQAANGQAAHALWAAARGRRSSMHT